VDTITWILDKAASCSGSSARSAAPVRRARRRHRRGSAPAAPAAGRRRRGRGAAAHRPYSGGAGTGPTGAAGLTPVLAGDTFNITISGVLNADDAADQIARLLERRDRFTGRALAAAL
jgi:hypothetical protein